MPSIEDRPPAIANPRRIGPGRVELRYRAQVTDLRSRLDEAEDSRGHLKVELEVSQRLERGCQRLIDRLEDRAQSAAEERERAEQAQKRLILTLGAMQKENELLRGEVARLAAAPEKRLTAGSRGSRGSPGFLRRLLGPRRRGARA